MLLLLTAITLLPYVPYGDSNLPNFIFFVADDMGFNDVGWKESTNTYSPNLDWLRNNEAMEFSRFYVYQKCSPTRTSLFTGRYTHHNGMQHDVGIIQTMTCGIEPSANNTFFTEKLKKCAGYDNYYMGKWHMGEYKWAYTPMYRGAFDYFKGYLNSHINYFNFTVDIMSSNGSYPEVRDWREGINELNFTTSGDTYTTTAFGVKAIEIIQNISVHNDETPFTMMLAWEAPHSPLHWAPQPWPHRALANGIYAENGDVNRKQYNSMIVAMDDYIGEIVNELKNRTVNGVSIWDNSFVFFFSDNGATNQGGSNYPLRGVKSTVWEGGIHVPAFVTGGRLNEELYGTVYNGIIHITDIYATLMDIVDLSTNDLMLDGSSFYSLLESDDIDSITSKTRTYLPFSVDTVQCDASYMNITVCGGIIKDYGDEGIYKLVIGGSIVGTSSKYYWNSLNSQDEQQPSITNCDPYDMNISQPTITDDFISNDCAANNEACLYRLDADPCEYDDLSLDDNYSDILEELMMDLIEIYYYDTKPAFWDSPICHLASDNYVYSYQSMIGNWRPFAQVFKNDTSLNKTNTEFYSCSCIDEPTLEPTIEPSLEPTLEPTESETPTDDDDGLFGALGVAGFVAIIVSVVVIAAALITFLIWRRRKKMVLTANLDYQTLDDNAPKRYMM